MEPKYNQSEEIDQNLGQPEGVVIGPIVTKQFWLWFILFDLLLITPLLIVGAFFYFSYTAPNDFTPQTVVIKPGESVMEIAIKLADQNIVQSEHLLFTILRYWQDPTQIKASTYNFTEPVDVFAVAERLVIGEFDNDLMSITFIEGESVAAFGARAAQELESFDSVQYELLTADLEGELFPETYRVPPDFTTKQLVELLNETHDEILAKYTEQIASSSLSYSQVTILASILEREANTPESMRTVAGIFLNRLEIGMPLQADATIEYALETPLGELPPGQLATELRELDSPYNTYLNTGLPPTPIGNPGETAIAAMLNPIESDYFYYITGNDGEFYYSKTYDQHLINIERHLR
ncbi:MAG: UPF0755 protein [Candidatus Paceibacteria bacterium]|jgi:UPF0755 protein